ncbi:hypothetical protein [Acidithiobacillus sp.]|uniref:hypothetical protein n=1 Tax=Acidithiobacillus sp. TaxID=1872118 RepID=UPI00260381BE|nr:hypothetical protein [Acidithiobacillus sp.]MDD5278713.1 hypothetical protein [Acidithiobacillus sp.]
MMDNKLLKTAAKVAFLGVAFGLAGCASAYIPDTVHNHYKAPASLTKVPGAENVTVTVDVQNHKKRHDEISRSKDVLGIPFAGVYLHIDKAFKTAMDTALTKRGFEVGAPGTHVLVVVKHFYMHGDVFTAAVSFDGDLLMQVSIPSVNYTHLVTVNKKKLESSSSWGQLVTMSPGRTYAANAFISAAVNQVVSNPKFITALLKAGHAGAVVPRLSADG